MYICSISDVQHAKLLTEQKKEHMTPANVKAYNEALTHSRLLKPDGPLELVHAYSITAGEQVISLRSVEAFQLQNLIVVLSP